MPRYIDADALLTTMRDRYDMLVKDYGENDAYAQGYGEAISLIDETETANAQEVKHGKWIPSIYGHICSVCELNESNAQNFGIYMRYCPRCGAIMDGDQNKN